MVERLRYSIVSLQEEVLSLFAEAQSVLSQVRTELPSNPLPGLDQAEMKLAEAVRRVRDLELRMVIVAPMKAGKSTIVNAIFRRELLPSRATAMTALPTEISFHPALREPVLELSETTHSSFVHVARKATELLQEKAAKGEELLVEEDLRPVVQKLRQGYAVPHYTTGRQPVLEALSDLNDLARLCRNSIDLFDEDIPDPVPSLTDAPKVRTPLWEANDRSVPTMLGNLVLVDTPGPNEAGAGHLLRSVVRNQLLRSSLILLVLDYTQLNSIAADEVGLTVKEVLDLDQRGQESLYILINKIDQRDQRQGTKDLTEEGVLDFVARKLNLPEVVKRGQVFEVSARAAFAAGEFFEALACDPELPKDSDAVQLLAQASFGFSGWKRILAKLERDDLRNEATELWKHSGFPVFLDKAINRLFEEAAPRCLAKALSEVKNQLLSSQRSADVCGRAAREDVDKLTAQLRALEGDVQRLGELRRRLPAEIATVREIVQKALEERISEICRSARISPETYLDKTKGESTLHRAVQGRLRRKKREGQILEFSGRGDKKRFQSLIKRDITERVSILQSRCREALESAVRSGHERLTQLLKEITAPIVQGAQARIQESLSLRLSPPAFELPEIEVGEIRLPVREYVKESRGRRKTISSPLYLFRYGDTFYLGQYTFQTQEPSTEKTVSDVSLQECIDSVNGMIDSSANEILEAVQDYVERDFEAYAEAFLAEVDSHLLNYQASLDHSLKVKGLSQAEQEKILATLSSFEQDIEASLARIGRCLHRARELSETFDLFVSHANEDRSFVEPLIRTFESKGLKVWDGEFAARSGDNITAVINEGISKCRRAVVVLSHHFHRKRWTKLELDILLIREKDGSKVIHPVQLEMTNEEFSSAFPVLADRFALRSPGLSPEEIAQRICEDLRIEGSLPHSVRR